MTTILQEVQFTSLLQITWNQDRIAKNFKAIIDYLRKDKARCESADSQLDSKLADLKAEIERQGKGKSQGGVTQQQLQKRLKEIETKSKEKIQSISAVVNKFKDNGSSTSIPANDYQSRIKILQDGLARLQQRTSSLEDTSINLSLQISKNFKQHQQISSQLNQRMFSQLDKIAPTIQSLLDKSKGLDQIQDRLQKMKQMSDSDASSSLLGLQEQFNQVRSQVQSLQKFETMQTELNSQSACSYSDQREEILRRLRQNQLSTQSVTNKFNQFFIKYDNLNIDGELALIKERVTDLEDRANNLPPPTSSSSDKEVPRADNRLAQKVNKINQQILSFVSKQDFNKEKQLNRQRHVKAERALANQVSLNEKRDQAIWKFLKSLSIPDQRQIESKLSQISNQVNLRNNILQKKNDQLTSRLQDCRKDIYGIKEDFENFKCNTTSGFNTLHHNKSETQFRETVKTRDRTYEDIKKDMQGKIHSLKMQIIGFMRELQKKYQGNKSFDNELMQLLNRYEELKSSLSKKADLVDTKKNLGYLESRIMNLFAMLHKQELNVDDARVAKKNWFCLSCDKMLGSYTGKIGKQIVWDAMPTRKLVFSNRKEDLPYIKQK